ncbi:hypothetical protein GBA63_19805 [Rubrobacter tropicus]|uniref:Metal binding domain-containing protein n=1 Tax=Rubrobacter tropicus TaxID=2653851 RepID=A0A6G8QDR6_9ACTN|nr:putative metal-binding protein [Rubrobacter tropicus]QIN84645.1 hypothetical protein GBA63_19805 [Rubrobacter tropicus]
MAEEVLVDPAVSRAKFDREVAQYREREDEYVRRGWFLVKAEYPEVFVVFGAPQLSPPALVFGALLDFTDYDLWPPSVKLVNPFTKEPYKNKDLPRRLPRQPTVPADQALAGQVQFIQPQDLMVAHDPEDVPFLCIPGVREYHEHPAHSGDSWLLHKDSGEGTLYFLLDQIHRYGVQPIAAYNVVMQPIIQYAQNELPE